MKSSVSVTLIIVGAALIALPAIATMRRCYAQSLAVSHGVTLGMSEGDIGDAYRYFCFVLGTAMIFFAIVGSRQVPK